VFERDDFGNSKGVGKEKPEFQQYKIALVVPDLSIDVIWMVKESNK
jgi:hypothetical protein